MGGTELEKPSSSPGTINRLPKVVPPVVPDLSNDRIQEQSERLAEMWDSLNDGQRDQVLSLIESLLSGTTASGNDDRAQVDETCSPSTVRIAKAQAARDST